MMTMKVGTFSSPTSTGQESFATGLPGTPTALFLTSAGSPDVNVIETGTRISFGATDGTNQWTTAAAVEYDDITPVVNGDDVMYGETVSGVVLRIVNFDGTLVAEAEFVSFNVDGTITLDWTTVDADNLVIGFMAWDQVTALAGTNSLSRQETQTVDVSGSIEELKVVLGANGLDINDGTVSCGWRRRPNLGPVNDGFGDDGGSYTARVDIGDDFIIDSGTSIYSGEQANVLGSSGGTIDNLTATSFDIVTTQSGYPAATLVLGWLALGDGGPWFGRGDALGLNNSAWLSNNMFPLGCFHVSRDAPPPLGVDGSKHNLSYGAWDRFDGQWAAVNWLEQDEALTIPGDPDIEPPCFAIDARALYDDRVDVALSDTTTVRGYRQLAVQTSPRDQTPAVTSTGTPPAGLRALFFVSTINPEAHGFVQAWLV